MPSLKDLTALAKRRGFIFPTSEIYGGLANSYDYGPLGAQMLKNIRSLWWREFIEQRDDMVGVDSQILLRPETWVASGHVSSFSDPLVEDTVTHKRYRADHLIKQYVIKKTEEIHKHSNPPLGEVVIENMTMNDMALFIKEHTIQSPDGNPLTEPKMFNLLFETSIGSVAGEKSKVYLRGETAQGIFTNFKNILNSSRVQLPFGVGQLGKSFRNEITTGQFIFRTLEFEQAEIEYFFDPHKSDWKTLFKRWQEDMERFVVRTLGVTKNNIRWRQHTDTERSHYSRDTWDLEYQFPFGWDELWGIAYRTDYDLKQHIKHSGQSLDYVDPQSGAKSTPHVIEPAVGVNRLFLMAFHDAYRLKDERVYLRFSPHVAPYQAAVFPLVANKPELVERARRIKNTLSTLFITYWDDRGNIGKRYRYQDEIGTPWCVTIDYETLENNTVTVRHRDTMKQERVLDTNLINYLQIQYEQ